jgi:hypothetical protein
MKRLFLALALSALIGSACVRSTQTAPSAGGPGGGMPLPSGTATPNMPPQQITHLPAVAPPVAAAPAVDNRSWYVRLCDYFKHKDARDAAARPAKYYEPPHEVYAD